MGKYKSLRISLIHRLQKIVALGVSRNLRCICMCSLSKTAYPRGMEKYRWEHHHIMCRDKHLPSQRPLEAWTTSVLLIYCCRQKWVARTDIRSAADVTSSCENIGLITLNENDRLQTLEWMAKPVQETLLKIFQGICMQVPLPPITKIDDDGCQLSHGG